MKPSKASAILLVALCFCFLFINCESNKSKATKPEPSGRPSDRVTGKESAAQKSGGQGSQESGTQNGGSGADTSQESQLATNPEDVGSDANPSAALTDEGRRRKETGTLSSLVDLWSKIVFPLGATLLLAASAYFLFTVRKRLDDIEKYLYGDLKPNISDIKGMRNPERNSDKSRPKSSELDLAGKSDLSILRAELIEVKSLAERLDSGLSKLREEIRVSNSGESGNEGRGLAGASDNSRKETFLLTDETEQTFTVGERTATFPFPVPTSVADCLRYLESASVAATEVKGEGLSEGGLFVEAPGGKFLLIGSRDDAQKVSFVIPKVMRFATQQDYTHYQKYFDCDDPSSGDVWIIRPAVVVSDSDKNEWSLKEKGQLEIRS